MSTIGPSLLESPSGLTVQVNANGSIRRMDYGEVTVNLFLGNEMEGAAGNLYLRRLGASVRWTPLLGPRSPAAVTVDEHGMTAHGSWNGIRYTLALVLSYSTPAWFWHVELTNEGNEDISADLVYAQDLALAPYGLIRLNEYYVSQYVDYTALEHPRRGTVLGVRQNLPIGGRNPWALVGSIGRGVSFATDALQLHGLAARGGRAADALAHMSLPGSRRQHEHSMAILQDAALRIAPAASVRSGFYGWLEPDHPPATSAADLAFADRALALPEATCVPPAAAPAARAQDAQTLFANRPLLAAAELTDAELDDLFGTTRRDEERHEGALLSFFYGANRHVVLREKELRVLRPHGHILRSGETLVPDEAALTSTAWMSGVFHSMLTQGHVSINRFLSTTHGYLGLFRSHGLRIFAELDGAYHLLDVPSAFEMSPSGCRWIYKHAGGLLEIRSWADIGRHEMNLSARPLAGPACRLLLSFHVAMNGDDGADPVAPRVTREGHGVTVGSIAECDIGRRFPNGYFRIEFDPATVIERVTGDEALYADGRSRAQPYVCVVTAPASAIGVRITGHLIESDATPRSAAAVAQRGKADDEAAGRYWERVSGRTTLGNAGSDSQSVREAARVQEFLPWLAHDALIHYLAPRGLEQYSGGGWGTRDVCQGPVEMMLALGEHDAVRDILRRVLRTQNADGDWPQWFMFFERERNIRPGDSHGDIVYWPLLALAQYLSASDDASFLDEVLPFFHPEGDERAEKTSVWGHAERALAVIAGRVIPHTSLPAYGHGDWNDSLQPADPTMRERLCSSWTATLHYQTFRELSAALVRSGRAAPAARLTADADRVRADFHRLLVVDDTIAAYAYFGDGAGPDYLIHPRDGDTGVRYSVLPMIHAILADLLSPEQARRHVEIIRSHLLGPDGAHLFDRPFRYRGGPMRRFQRIETSTFVGREVGNMYMHAHLRYAQAMAHYGDADAFFLALQQANPVGIRDVVRSAALRQRNCYYSSSDPAFADRYEALEHYDRVAAGDVPLEGGWRVYSSGAGIALRLVREFFLGLRRERSALIVDPAVPKALDGLQARLDVGGRLLDVTYKVEKRGCGPLELVLNGTPLAFERVANPYRTGAARVLEETLAERLSPGANALVVALE